VLIANLLTIIGIVAEATFIAVLVWRRTYRSFPVFFSYIVWGLAGDSTILTLQIVTQSQSLAPFEIETYIDSLFQYLVLIELAWSILRPMQRSLPKGFLPGISLLIAATAVLAWPLSQIKETPGLAWQFLFALHTQRTFAILRVLFFLALVCSSQFLRISWRDREFQVATGLGFYSLVSLAGTIVHSHQFFGLQYLYVDVAVGCSYLLALGYWIYSFVQQEAPRREMTPEMQDLLLGMAGALRRQRDRLSQTTISS
jgi:hypothetical protein